MQTIQGKTVLITGASSGLGRAMALSLASGGNNLVVTARREPLLASLKREVEALGSRCEAVTADSSDAAQVKAVLDAAYARFGRVDIAVLNAGGGEAMTMADAPAEDVLRLMRMNYDTLVNFLCPLIAHMKERGGTIAYTSSPAGVFGLPKSGPYGAAKSAGSYLFDTCRIELAKTPIRLVALYPGFTYTEGMDGSDVPIKALIITKERAVREMLWAIGKGKESYMFPRRIRWLIRLGQLVPEPIRRRVLALAA